MKRKILLVILVLIAVFIIADLIVSSKCLSVSFYSYSNEKTIRPITIVQLSDFHNL